jgi:KipI family sensor histidine kinase inhibitor
MVNRSWRKRALYTLRTMTQKSDEPRFRPASDQSLLIYFGDRVSLDAHKRVRELLRELEVAPIATVRNVHPAYYSVLLDFDGLTTDHEELEKALRERLSRVQDVVLPEPREVKIPVCYGEEFGPDLEAIAALHRLTPRQAIELHSSVTYTVYFMGFVPGFAYLGELPAQLATPRLGTPRRSTPAGSVGIADSQTGVYPFATPGGWRLIGQTPIEMFRSDRTEMSLLNVGDHVRFVPISAEQFAKLSGA